LTDSFDSFSVCWRISSRVSWRTSGNLSIGHTNHHHRLSTLVCDG
jgi:hypothetical protein